MKHVLLPSSLNAVQWPAASHQTHTWPWDPVDEHSGRYGSKTLALPSGCRPLSNKMLQLVPALANGIEPFFVATGSSNWVHPLAGRNHERLIFAWYRLACTVSAYSIILKAMLGLNLPSYKTIAAQLKAADQAAMYEATAALPQHHKVLVMKPSMICRGCVLCD